MKPMVYTHSKTKEILYDGLYENYYFVIVSYGTHPCAYVKIPKNHAFYKKDYNELNIRCHGCLTYGGDLGSIIPNEDDSWFIGWDYAHAGDYLVFEALLDVDTSKEKKWTTEEIYEEVKAVIDQLISYESKKFIRNCTYKEVRAYYEEHPSDWQVGALLGAFGKVWQRNEQSWQMRMRIEFPNIFQEDVLNKLIEIPKLKK